MSLGLFELHCDEVLRTLTKRTESICNLFLTRMSHNNQKLNQRWYFLLNTALFPRPRDQTPGMCLSEYFFKGGYLLFNPGAVSIKRSSAYLCNYCVVTEFNMKATLTVLLSHSLRKEFEVIADKALTTPTNTQHLMELKEIMVKATEKDLPLLEEKMVESRHRYYIYCMLRMCT